MHRTLPATEQLQQIDTRIRDLKESIIENIKSSQILRSNYTSLMHSNKESNEQLKSDIFDAISNLKKNFIENTEGSEDFVKDMEKDLNSLNYEKRSVGDGILLLNKRIKELEGIFGCFKGEEEEEDIDM